MANEDDMQRLALAHSGVVEVTSYSIGGQPIAWPYFERTKSKLTLRPGIWAVRCPLPEKEVLIESAPDLYFDDAYYRRYDIMLVRLANMSEAELTATLARSYEIQAAKARKS
jgi:hypothetical protein